MLVTYFITKPKKKEELLNTSTSRE